MWSKFTRRWPEGLRASLPLALPTAAVGVSFGLLAAQVIGGLAAVVMSALVWSGTAQFAAVSVLAGGGSVWLAGGTALLGNTRFLPMGFALAPSMTGRPGRRILTGALLADASFAIAERGGGKFDPAAVVWAAPVQYVGWLGGTIVGVAGARAIADPGRWGLDVLFPVFYLSLVLPMLLPKPAAGSSARSATESSGGSPADRRPLVAAALAVVITLVLTPVAPPGVPVLAAAAAALIGLLPAKRTASDPGREERST